MKKNLRTTTRHHLLAFLLIFLFQATSLIAQNVVSGTITSSDDGLPIPGVNIIVKGTTRGAVSDSCVQCSNATKGLGFKLILSYIF